VLVGVGHALSGRKFQPIIIRRRRISVPVSTSSCHLLHFLVSDVTSQCSVYSCSTVRAARSIWVLGSNYLVATYCGSL